MKEVSAFKIWDVYVNKASSAVSELEETYMSIFWILLAGMTSNVWDTCTLRSDQLKQAIFWWKRDPEDGRIIVMNKRQWVKATVTVVT